MHTKQQQAAFFESLCDEWLATPEVEEQMWGERYSAQFDLALLQQFKSQSDILLLKSPQTAEKLTRACLLIAAFLTNESLALPIACWARGNWALFHDPNQAVLLYQQAIECCIVLDHAQYVVRLLGNLLGALCGTGDYPMAHATYAKLVEWEQRLLPEDRRFLIVPTQNYGLFLHEAGDYQDALAAHAHARMLAVEAEDRCRMVEIDVNRALTLAELGRLAESEQLLLATHSIAIQLGERVTVARIEMDLGDLCTIQDRPADSFRYLYAAQRRFAELDNNMELGSVLLCEANLLARIGAYAEANRYYRQAQTHFQQRAMLSQAGLSLLGEILTNRLIGRFDRATQSLPQARLLWQQANQPERLMTVEFEQAALFLTQDNVNHALQHLQRSFPIPPDQTLYPHHTIRYWQLSAEIQTALWRQSADAVYREQAQVAFQRVIDLGEKYHDHAARRQGLVGLARLVLETTPIKAQSLLEEAQIYDDWVRQELSLQELKASFLNLVNEPLPLLAKLAIENQQPLEALAYVWRAKGSALLEMFAATIPPTPHVKLAVSPLEQELEDARRQLAVLRWRVRQQAENLPETMLESQFPAIRQLHYRLQELRRQQREQTPRQRDLNTLDKAAILSVLQRLDADLLIEYFSCDQTIWAICAERTGQCRAVEIAEVEAINDLREELYFSFQNAQKLFGHSSAIAPRQRAELLLEAQSLLTNAYQLLIKPLGALPAGAHLLIAPCDSLFHLPFAAFWDGQQYLVQAHSLEMMPTGGLLRYPPPPMARGRPFVLAATKEGALPAIANEARAVQQLFSEVELWLDKPGAIERLMQLASAPHFLHIATHMTESELPLFNALHCAGELLTIEKCYELPLQGTALVVLSGCSTVKGLESDGALLALSSALMAAGVHKIINSIWAIDDHYTTVWMRCFYQHLRAGAAPQLALCQTQRVQCNDSHYAHPLFWAAFACYRR